MSPHWLDTALAAGLFEPGECKFPKTEMKSNQRLASSTNRAACRGAGVEAWGLCPGRQLPPDCRLGDAWRVLDSLGS